MNVLSTFDGISCGQIALNRAGVKYDKYFSSEIDKHSIGVTQENYPETIQLGSIVDIKYNRLCTWIDLFIGGSPCQSFSRSGDGSGFDGKSGLFFEYLRLLREIQQINPDVYFLLENVLMKKEWVKVITEELGVEPIEIDSSLVSAQKRRRLYWTNIPNITIPEDKGVLLSDIIESGGDFNAFDNLVTRVDDEWRVKNGTKLGYLIAENGDSVNLEFPNSKTRRGRVAKQKANTLNTACNQGYFMDGLIKKFTPLECERLQTVPDNYTAVAADTRRREMLGNGWTVDVIAHIFKGLNK